MRTVVTKFGGTSLADANQFKKVKEILASDPSRRIVVASAPGKRFKNDIKVTDLLLDAYEKARNGHDYLPAINAVRDRFQSILDELNLTFPLDAEINEILRVLETKPGRDYMASRGEYLNSRILSVYLNYTFVDPAWCICFNSSGTLDAAMTRRALAASLRPLQNAVIAGFYGADSDGNIHTFSRGGSDITGSLAARSIEADLYENWTDVSGLLAADPRIVDDPKSVRYLSYRELRTLSYMGASVLHTDAVLPVTDLGIPINIRNTNAPADAGTMIVRKLPKEEKKYPVTGVAGMRGMSVVQIEKVMVSDGAGFSAVILGILKNRGIPFEQCLTGIDTVTLVIRSELLEPIKSDLIEEINSTLKPDYLGVKENLSMIAVVGEKDSDTSNANVKVLSALSQFGIEISTINQGAGKLNLLIGVPEEKYADSIKAIYSAIENE